MKWLTSRHLGRTAVVALAVGTAATLAACSGGPAGADGSAEEVDPLRVAMVTHAAPGDTFWDIVRGGAEVGAERNNIELLYTSDPEGGRQAQLIEQAVDQDVDGIVVTLAKAEAVSGAVESAVDAGIPVFSVNAGEDSYKEFGAIAHFGQNDLVAGQAAGERLNEEGASRAVCVIQEQGHVGLEARCEGLAETFEGESEVLYVEGTDMTNVSSTLVAKLQTNADIDFVVGLGAPFTTTAVDAVAEAGSEAKLGMFDSNEDAIAGLKDGTVQFLVEQQGYLQGFESIEAVRHYVDGGYVLGGGQAVLTGPQIIDADNVDMLNIAPPVSDDTEDEG